MLERWKKKDFNLKGTLECLQMRAMNCFVFSNGENTEEQQAMKSASVRSNSSTSTDRDMKRSGSEFNSQNISDTSAGSVERPQYPSFSQKASNLMAFTFSELRAATKGFSRSLMIGEGGFGYVYRGSIKSPNDPNKKLEIAVKQLSRRGLQGHKEWLTVVNVLGIVEHKNLVKLVGYCAEDDERGIQRLLIYEFMPNGSVGDHLSARSTTPLSWAMRLRIVLDAARGLTYLHEGMDFQAIKKMQIIMNGIAHQSSVRNDHGGCKIIFRDFKTSNILLDEHWNAKLSDFGLARQGPDEGLTHVSTAVVGTVGYAAPEYMQTGHLTAKSDIWSYGVFLYELITGCPPIDRNRPKGEQKLLEWVRPYISDAKKFRIILDPRLDGAHALKSATKLSTIANRCLVGRPKSRPKMSEVAEMVARLVERAEVGTPQPPLSTNSPRGATTEEEEKKKRRLVWRGWIPKLVKTNR